MGGLRRAATTVRAVVCAAVLAALASASGCAQQPGEGERAAALARLAPYVPMLEQDFEQTVAALPSELTRQVEVSSDGLSAQGMFSLQLSDGSCAAVRYEFGPQFVLAGDHDALAVSDPQILPAELCP